MRHARGEAAYHSPLLWILLLCLGGILAALHMPPVEASALLTATPSITPTPTELPTSAAPTEPTQLIYPLDGAVVRTMRPDLQSGTAARAWLVYYEISTDGERFSTYIVQGVGAGYPPLMDSQLNPLDFVPPLPDGRYFWYTYACRPTGMGGCGPRSEIWTFVVDTQFAY